MRQHLQCIPAHNRLRIPQHFQISSLTLTSSPRVARSAARVVAQIKWRCYCGRAETCIFYAAEYEVSQDLSLFLKEQHRLDPQLYPVALIAHRALFCAVHAASYA